MSAASAILEVDGLSKHFYEDDNFVTKLLPGRQVKTVQAVDDVDITVEEGQTLGLVGESGCGKSTLARTILQLTDATDGAVRYRGDDVTGYDDEELTAFRGEVQMIFQDPFSSLNPRYTVKRMLMEPMEVHDVGSSTAEREERAAELIERVGLGEEHLDRYPHEFSGGQRQRVNIARALSVEPKLVIADEPVSALDVSVQAQILNLLEELRDEMGLTMLFISHNLSVIRQISDEVAVMYLGEIVERAETQDLFENPRHPYSRVLVSSIPIPDPTDDREQMTLEGDVPTPIDPPSGCRFHPRCPNVISPDDWDQDQTVWREVLQFKKRVENKEVNPSAMREQLETMESTVSDEDVIEALYEEHIGREEFSGEGTDPLDPENRETLHEVLDALVAGDRETALETLRAEYTTVCEREIPERIHTEDHTVLCHLYDDSVAGEPLEQNPVS